MIKSTGASRSTTRVETGGDRHLFAGLGLGARGWDWGVGVEVQRRDQRQRQGLEEVRGPLSSKEI